jgi:hypothetical protein
MVKKASEGESRGNGHIADERILQMIAEKSQGRIDTRRGVTLKDLNGYNGRRKN